MGEECADHAFGGSLVQKLDLRAWYALELRADLKARAIGVCATFAVEAVTALGIAKSARATFAVILARYAFVIFADLSVAIGVGAAITGDASARCWDTDLSRIAVQILSARHTFVIFADLSATIGICAAIAFGASARDTDKAVIALCITFADATLILIAD